MSSQTTSRNAYACVIDNDASLGRVIGKWTEDDAERILGELLMAGAPDSAVEQAGEWFAGTRPSDVPFRRNLPGRPEELLFLSWPDQRSEVVEDCDAYAVLTHADGGASVALTRHATLEDEARAFSLLPDELHLISLDYGCGKAAGDRYFHYDAA